MSSCGYIVNSTVINLFMNCLRLSTFTRNYFDLNKLPVNKHPFTLPFYTATLYSNPHTKVAVYSLLKQAFSTVSTSPITTYEKRLKGI